MTSRRRSHGNSRARQRRWRGVANATGLIAGYALDAAVGDPRRWHPVAGFGRWAAALERRTYAPSRRAGVRHAAIAVGVPVAVAGAAALATRRRPLLRAAVTAAATWAVLGGRSLRSEAVMLADALTTGDLRAARGRLPNLCGRDATDLSAAELARATVESVAENTSDAVVAPLVWGALAGLPGLIGYRAVNTLDSMVGHRTQRYEHFGTAAARLDDVANLLPSRLTAMLTALGAPAVGGSPVRATWVWLRDGNQHPSPNAGQCEAAMAGALGVRLGGSNVYFGHTEVRPKLGNGPQPVAEDARRAARLCAIVGVGALVVCAARALASRRCGRRRRRP